MLAPLGAPRERRGVERPRGAVRRAGRRGPAGHPAGGLLARVLDDRRGRGRAGARPRARRVLLDGAQGLGAVPVDVRPGLRLLRRVGPEVAVRAERHRLPVRARRARRRAAAALARLRARSRTRAARSSRPSATTPAASTSASRRHQLAWALAALDVLEEAGHRAVQDRGAATRPRARRQLADAGQRVGAARPTRRWCPGRTPDPEAAVERAAGRAGFVLRDLPGTPYVRASVGAWNERGRARALLACARPDDGYLSIITMIAEHERRRHRRRPRTRRARRRRDRLEPTRARRAATSTARVPPRGSRARRRR